MKTDIIDKLRKFNLKGRGGGSFETWKKWNSVLSFPSRRKYVICNAAEGELGSMKDGYILSHYLNDVINGIIIALHTVGAEKAYFYLREDYYNDHKRNLISLIGNQPIDLIKKPDIGYVAGEETVICEIIEGNKGIPRKKPPYVSEKGLFGCPTLVNNVETFYCISKISKNEYNHERFYSISGDVKNSGVFLAEEDISIKNLLEQTNNYPTFDFFVQCGGGAGGEFLSEKNLAKSIPGVGAVLVYEKSRTDLYFLVERITDFFLKGSCNKCAPCREGIFLIHEMAKKKRFDYQKTIEILYSLENSSFCSLGKSAVIPLSSLLILLKKND